MASGQAVRGQEHELLAAVVDPAQRDAVGARDPAETLRESVGELGQRGGVGRQRRDVVQGLEALALFVELRGLLGNARLEIAVERLQVARHAVEALGERAELVGRDAFHARAEVALADARRRLLQAPNGFQHEQVAGDEQHGGAQHRKRGHSDLQQVQERGPARHVALDRRDERVDVRGEFRGFLGERRRHCVGRRAPVLAESLPVGLHRGEALAHDVVPRHGQRTIGIAAAKQIEAVVEFRGKTRQSRLVVQGHGERPAVRLHAHAPRLVDRCGAAVELPGDP